MTSIAAYFGVSLDALAQANHLTDESTVDVGQMLTIPPRMPVRLTVNPIHGSAGTTFTLSLTGAQGYEQVTFQIVGPGDKFTGPPHTAGPDGSVTASYQSSGTETAGLYTVGALGNDGTAARTTFRIDAASPSS